MVQFNGHTAPEYYRFSAPKLELWGLFKCGLGFRTLAPGLGVDPHPSKQHPTSLDGRSGSRRNVDCQAAWVMQ